MAESMKIQTPVSEFAKGSVVWVTVGPKRTRCRGEVQAINPKNLKVRFTWGNGRTTVRDFSIADGLVTDVEFASDLPQVSTTEPMKVEPSRSASDVGATPRSRTSREPRQFWRDGKAITNPSVNSLSGIAYFHTKGVDGKARIPVQRLLEVLAALGVTDPRIESFDVRLPGGPRISSSAVGAKLPAEKTAGRTSKTEYRRAS